MMLIRLGQCDVMMDIIIMIHCRLFIWMRWEKGPIPSYVLLHAGQNESISLLLYYECIVVVVAYYYAPYIIKPISTLQTGLALFWDGNFSEGHCKPPFFNHLHRAKHAFPCVIVCCYQKPFVPFIWTHTGMAYKSFIKQINPQLSNL